ncbi:MAG: hypothetical protein QOD92_1036 [Acidimicrobiaceae bacterium]
MTIDDDLAGVVQRGVHAALGPYLPKLLALEKRTCTFGEAGKIIGCSDRHVAKLVADGVLPIVPHNGTKKVIPRIAVVALADGVDVAVVMAERARVLAGALDQSVGSSSSPEDAGEGPAGL